MKLIKTLSFVACMAPLSMTLAANPSTCIPSSLLKNPAAAGAIHDSSLSNKLVTNRWYIVGLGNHSSDMEKLLNKNNTWTEGVSGQWIKNGIFCSYFSKEASHFVNLQFYFNNPNK